MLTSLTDCVTLNNGVKMPWFGLVVFQASNDDARQAVLWAVQAGYRAIDTAAIYGNEKGVGDAIEQCGVDRKELFITSKVWNSMQGYDTTMQAFETTMADLKLDYLDLYLIHWPLPKNEKYVETWKAMEKLYHDGRIRAIGISNFYEPWIQRILDECEVVPAINQMEFHPHLQRPALREFCQKAGIVYEAYSPLAQGAIFQDEALIAMAKKYNKSVAQLVLRFEMQLGVVVIPKSVHQDRIISNAQVFDFEISPEDMETLKGLDQNKIICGQDPNEFYVV